MRTSSQPSCNVPFLHFPQAYMAYAWPQCPDDSAPTFSRELSYAWPCNCPCLGCHDQHISTLAQRSVVKSLQLHPARAYTLDQYVAHEEHVLSLPSRASFWHTPTPHPMATYFLPVSATTTAVFYFHQGKATGHLQQYCSNLLPHVITAPTCSNSMQRKLLQAHQLPGPMHAAVVSLGWQLRKSSPLGYKGHVKLEKRGWFWWGRKGEKEHSKWSSQFPFLVSKMVGPSGKKEGGWAFE